MGLSVRTAPPTLAKAVLACALVGLLAALAAPVLAAPAVAGRSVDAATSRVLAAPPGSTAPRSAAARDRPSTTRVRVVDHNIEKRPVALKRALVAARASSAQVVTLQEVCWWQVDGVRTRNPGWTVAWKPVRNNDRCRRPSHPDGALGLRRKVGNLAIWTGGNDGKASTHTYRPQRVDSDRVGLACVSWVQGARHRACSVHLVSPSAPEDVRVRTRQAKALRRITGPWVAADELVVLGGDFNAHPGRRTMRFLYRSEAGRFREATARRQGGKACRCPADTLDDRRGKIDYVFFSANRMAERARRHLRVVRTVSDHHLLVGWADVDASRR